MTRFAIRTLTDPKADVIDLASRMERYMPSNYGAFPVMSRDMGTLGVLIAGQDSSGWTLDDYVLPRLASGLYGAREIPAAEALNAWVRIGAE